MAVSGSAMFAMPRWSAIDDGDDIEDEEDDSEGEDEESISGEELGAMLGEMLAGFVTSPDFDKGFRYSGKVLSHHQLEETNEKLRRRLASTLVNVTNPLRYGSGGLLDNEFVCLRVQDKINELGEETDKLCDSCAKAKRGNSALTQHTELMQHRVNQLLSWLEWLKMPTPPPTNSTGCGMQGCSCMHSCSGGGLPLPEGAPAAMKQAFRAASESYPTQATAAEDDEGSVDSEQRWQAADDAMLQLLKEEEESKRKMQEKVNVAKQKKQKKKAKKKGGRDQGVANAKPSTKHSELEADPPPEVTAGETINDAHGQTHRNVKPARTDISDHVLDRLHGGQNYRQMMVTPYQALEVLGDEEEAAPIEGLVRMHAQKAANKGGRASGASTQEATAKRQQPATNSKSGLGHSSSRAIVSQWQASQDPVRQQVSAPCKHINGDIASASDAEVSDKQAQQMQAQFMKLVKRKGKWDHTWLVNCLNPVTVQHDPEVRSAYKQLPKLVQQAVWRSIPAGGAQAKQPVSNSGARGVRGKTVYENGRTSAVIEAAGQGPPPLQNASVWSMGDCTPASSEFLRLLASRGIHHHSGLTTALNLSAPAYDAPVRSAYKSLMRPDQAAVWRMLPKESPEKVQRKPRYPHDCPDPAPSVAPHSSPDLPGMPMPGLGVRPTMSRLGCRPAPRAAGAPPVPPAPGLSKPSFYSPGLGSAPFGGADIFASSLSPKLGGLSWSVQEPNPHAAALDLNEEEESKLCVVCLDKRCDALLLPCKHAVMCVSCAVLVKNSTGECPYCRESIETVMCVHN